MSIPSPTSFKPRSSSLSPNSHPLSKPQSQLQSQPQSQSTFHLPTQTQIQTPHKKCIYLLTTYTCSHFVQPFTHPTNIIHTENCIARFGGNCSSPGYRYEILGNRGEVCEACLRGGKSMKEGKDSSGELRLRDEERGNDFEMEMKGDKDIMLGIDSKAKTDEETIHYPRKNQESDEIAETSSTSVFPLKKPRISPEMYKRCGERSGNGRGKRMMTYESQRAVSTQRKSMIAGKQRVSVIIEEGWEYDGDGNGCGILDSSLRCGRERRRKCWEILWERLRNL
ncbi:hypothetical protein H4I95_05139 [Botrytis cinerea]